MLDNVPIDNNEYGDAARGVKLETGEGAKQFAAITDGTLVFANGMKNSVEALDEDGRTLVMDGEQMAFEVRA